jgi:hypothetical protein
VTDPTPAPRARKKPTPKAAQAEPAAEPAVPAVAQTLAGKFAEVQLAVDRVPRSGHAVVRMKGGGEYSYDYPTENDLMAAVRSQLASRNVATFVSWPNVQMHGSLTIVHGLMTFVDGDTGERESIEFVGSGADQGDKGLYKAMTGAMRYAIWKTFLIPTGDEPDSDHQPVTQQQQAAAKVATLGPGHRQAIQAILTKLDDLLGRDKGSSEAVWGKGISDKYKVARWTDVPADRGDSIVQALSQRLLEEQTKAAEQQAKAEPEPEAVPAASDADDYTLPVSGDPTEPADDVPFD